MIKPYTFAIVILYVSSLFCTSLAHGNPFCWTPGFDWDLCCHPRFGSGGNKEVCWDGLGMYSYERCCFSNRSDFGPAGRNGSVTATPRILSTIGRIDVSANRQFRASAERDVLLYKDTSLGLQFLSMDRGSLEMIMSGAFRFESYNMLSIMIESPSPNLLVSLEKQYGFVVLGVFPEQLDYLIVHRQRFEAAVGD